MSNYKIKNTFWSILMLTCFATACTKDDASSSKITLLSFGPSGIQHGDKVKFIGQNLDKVTSVILPTDVEIPASQFATKTSTLLEVVVPEEAQAGKVTLKTPQGDIVTKTMLNFLVPVNITSITPAVVKPGNTISIKGTFVDWITSVTFNAGVEVTDFVSKSHGEVVVTVPAEAKTGYITFETGGTKPLKITTTDPLTVILPTVSAISPASVKHAENLTITGTDLDLVTSITFPDKTKVTSFVSQTETQLVVVVPVTTKSGALTLGVASGVTIVPTQQLVITLPVATSFSPSDPNAQVDGATLVITGTDLDLVKSIKFPGVATEVTNFTQSSTQISAVIPNGTMGGTMIFTTIHDFKVPVTVPFGNQLTLLSVIYDEQPEGTFGAGGGWGTTSSDVASTDFVRVGTKSIKATYGGDYGGAAQFGTWGKSPLSVNGATYFAFSIYGGAGTDGKKINVNVSGSQVLVVIAAGKWTDVQIPLSSVGSPTTISEVWFQDQGWSGTVYIDQVGLK